MQELLSNLRYAVRQFRKSPVFTAAAVLTMALGIGGTTAIFTLIHAVMMRSLPVSDPGRLYRVGEGDDCCVEGGPQDRWGFYSFPLYERLKAESPEFEDMAAFQAGRGLQSVRRQGEAAASPLRSEYVTGSYFSMLGVRAFGGRMFSPEDDQPAAAPVVVLSHRAWQTRYGSDPSVVGSTFMVEGHPFTVIGVAPPGFFGETLGSDPPEVWIPVHQEPLIDGEGALLPQSVGAWLRMMGRLRPGASIAGMGPRLTGVLRQWIQYDSGYPANWMPDVIRTLPKQVINVVPAGAGVAVMKEEYGRSLQILLSVCGLVLLIACANVANLLLARAVTRRAQTAVRLALGATRRQIIAQALTESVLLAVGGGLAGLVVAVAAARLLLSLAFHSAHFLPISPMPSLVVLAFACGLALVSGMIFGAAPAWFATRTDPAEALHGAGRSTGDHSSLTRKGLLVVQATVSVVLVAGATMLTRSLNKLERQDFGYQIPRRVLVELHNPPATYTEAKLAALYRELEDRLNRLPSVQGSGLALYNPLTDNWGELVYVAEKTADGKVKLRDDRVKDILVSTIDLEARFGCKRKTKWRGYKVATVEVGNSGFIAAADVIKGNQYDGDSMIKIADQLPVDVVKDSNGAAKEPVLVGDSHFGAIDDRVTMKETANVTVVAPPHVKSNAMKIHEAGFSINEDHTILTCRSGASYTKATGTLTGKDFPLNRRDCGDCPYISECFGGGRRRKISIHEHHEKLVEIEEYAKTEEYKELMQLRGRIEPKQDELMNDYGMRRASYLGQRKTAFQARMKSLAINLNRLNRLMQNRKNPLKIELPKSIPPDIFKKAG